MRHTSKAIALLSVSALAFTCASLAYGQTAADTSQKDDSGLDEIVIVGMRKALNNAQEFKRNSEEIVDSISAVDIGALPDRSVTEALQRVPGISIGRTDEPRDIDRLNVEGSGVQIRGLTWVRSEINGRDSFGAKNGRALGWEDVTPELAAGVDVYKNPSADIVEGGLGGTINLRTRMPFDSDGQIIGLSADATNGDLRHKWTPSASGLYSNRWDTKIGEIGILVDVAHSELSSRLNALEVDPYNAHSTKTQSSYDGGTTFNFNGDNSISGQPKSVVMVPTGVEYRLEDRDRTRDGQYGALQWKPNDELEFYGTYFRSTSKLVSTDHFAQTSACCSATNNQSFLNQPAAGTGFTFDGDGNFLTGTIVDGGGGGNGVANSFLLNLGTRYGEENDETWDASGGVKWNHDRWHVNADFQRIFSRRDDYDMTVYNTVTATGGVGLDLRGDLPVIKMQNLTATPNVFNLYAAMDHNEIDKADETAGKLDTVYDVDGDFLKSLKFGFRSTDRHSIQRDGGYNWQLISAPWAFAQTATAGQFPEHQEVINFNNFFGGSMPSLWMPSVDLAKNKGLLASYMQKLLYTPNLGKNLPAVPPGYYGATANSPFPAGSLASYLPTWAAANVDANGKLINPAQPVNGITLWTPFNGNYDYAPTSTSGLGTNDQTERTNAIYAQMRFGHENLFGWNLPWDGNIGVRVVRTDTESTGLGHVASVVQAGDLSAYSADALRALTFANGANTITSFSNHYTDVLPSLNLRFKPQDDMAIRFAAATSIVRPDFYQLTPSFTMSGTYQNRLATAADNVINSATHQPYTQQELNDAANRGAPVMYNTGVSFAFNTGNPKLKPMRAQSFDLSYEWYLKPGSMVSFGVFDKEIYDYIQSDQTVVQVTNNGITQTVVGNVPQNHGHGRIMGLEGQFTYFYDFLPGVLSGLGTDINFTILDSSGTQNTSGSVFDGSQIGASKLKLPLEQLSTYTLNAALLYTKYDFDFRLAYNWRSRYLMAASASNVQAPAYMEDYGQLDASLIYSINEHFKVGVQAANLLATKNVISIDERDNWYYGTQGNMSDSLIYKHNYTVADRRYSLVFRAVY
ncbi:TonB-dependent receptor [Nitrospirillum sp. BR 11164]|uniref:TonB-dependent receptor n=1 Tax=Nitrospirillum sp. BR 11164 TaxID=3104324 RepID=UPI002AFE0FB3|nr:TonB-dependent receptor [Nitrospirillum sp. BR 11164]MEA1652745.1 TonB-dependent receptor [Nitrospirillum sp. BR 11164]